MTTYSQAGVNLEAANDFVQGIKKIASPTNNSQVINGIGGFAGLFRIPKGYENPVLVACTDGVGTKLKIAYESGKLEGIGQDLVAMCVNDLLCTGAKPLFFLDYLATGKLDSTQALIIANSIAQACLESGSVLLGGETAELPGMLPPKGYELAGFSVGIVEENKILNPDCTEEGDLLIGIPSSGVHSNGYSLIHSIIQKSNLDLQKTYSGFSRPLVDELLEPTKIYTKTIQPILDKVKAIAHITGGGLPENLPRALNKSLKAKIKLNSWTIPQIFNFIQEQGSVEESEMFKVFNMGIGLVLIVSPVEIQAVRNYLNEANQEFYELGYLEKKNNLDESSVDLV
jgi:phosphoribosylformylglycinamidine cyclo-ligase